MHEFPIRVYATLLFKDHFMASYTSDVKGGITVGLQLQPGFKTSLGRQADISADPVTFFVGYLIRM
jgi:hypothetical protein